MTTTHHRTSDIPIAIVAVGGIFPGASDPRRFMDNILAGKNAVITVPPERWAAPANVMASQTPGPDTALCDQAGLITDFSFDGSGFSMDKDVLKGLDPLHHLVLAASRQALSSCHLSQEDKKRTGVILGALCLPTESVSALSDKIMNGNIPNTMSVQEGMAASVVSGPATIVSQAFGLSGGSFTIDGACASSLVALKLAAQHLILGNADVMVTGGVSRPDSLYTQVGFSQLSALSPTGRCAPFDKDSNGLVVGEGVGILVLKRLKDALACKDKILGIIRGIGMSNDIEGNLVAPASEGQVRAMTSAFDHAGWHPGDIQYMECHGTGTPLGDLVESTSISNLIKHYQTKEACFSMGSVKSMTGHLLTAAGAASLIKTILSMNQKVLPPSLNFTQFSDKNPLNQTKIRVQTKPEAWDVPWSGTTRKAAVSAFGFGGVNAHVLIEEFKPSSRTYPVSWEKPSSASLKIQEEIKGHMDVAIIGMDIQTAQCRELSHLADLISGKRRPAPESLVPHWKKLYSADKPLPDIKGFPIGDLSLDPRQFHIPPLQFSDILPQHLIALKAARNALVHAGISPRPGKGQAQRTRFGCAAGIDFDCKAANFFSRWTAKGRNPSTEPPEHFGPALTFDRTLGSLGGIVVSRMAREFQLGGPCFTLSAGAVSAMKAIETAMISLAAGETDVFLCVCVDMGTDLRSFLINQSIEDFCSALPAEGAGAIVLKPLDQAKKDRDTIWGIIKAVSGVSSNASGKETACYQDSLDQLWETSGISPDAVNIYTTHTEGNSHRGILEKNALEDFLSRHGFGTSPDALPVSAQSAMPFLGDARTASGIFAIIASCMGLHGNLPMVTHEDVSWENAVTAAISQDGNCAHVLMQLPTRKNRREKSKPTASAHLQTIAADTASAHEKFLELARTNMETMQAQFAAIARHARENPHSITKMPKPPLLDRNQCLEFATGKTGSVLGPEFSIVDTYPVRVRLPDEPLMLVDRVMDIQAIPLSLDKGKIITQHDVKHSAWYLDGPKAPVSITIEAGQADLLLCHYLGIDHRVMGKRKYRLLDAKVTFHRSLPEQGETIEYHIEIDRFLKQGEVYLFFFHYQGYIGSELLISMRDGCAGFFTEQETRDSGGIVLKKEDNQQDTNHTDIPSPLVQMPSDSSVFGDEQISALRKGNLEKAFGPAFTGMKLGQYQRLPGGRMHLIDRVTQFLPNGGKFGLGNIVAELDIHPDDWFLTCHFIDDKVMPGTLMYECCAHTLRVFVQRFGWVSPDPSVYFDVLPNNESDLKCRGPVTPQTRKARYEIDIKQMGYGPEPFVIADAQMFSDDLHIVHYQNMGMRLVGLDKNILQQIWRKS